MTLLLTNEDMDGLLDIDDYMVTLENMYNDFGKGEAKELERIGAVYPYSTDDTYVFKAMSGVYPSSDVVALRIDSDMVSWKQGRHVKLPVAPGDRWVGLLFLFSLSEIKLLAVLQDGLIQRTRVGATTALGAKYLAREDASVYGILGTGWQAGGQIQAMAKVRELKKIKVYSPNSQNRKKFAEKWTSQLGIEIIPVDSAREAVLGSDIVGCATNSLEPLIEGDWLNEGMHVTCIRPVELAPSVLERADICFMNNLFKGSTARPSQEVVGRSLSAAAQKGFSGGSSKENYDIDWKKFPKLKDLIAGLIPGRVDERQITCFVNNAGHSLQLAAMGTLAYQRAKEKGVGKELPDDWFSQNVHP